MRSTPSYDAESKQSHGYYKDYFKKNLSYIKKTQLSFYKYRVYINFLSHINIFTLHDKF
jgi:hypothetical protein